MTEPALTDLLRRAREYDRDAFAEVYRRTLPAVYRYCAARTDQPADAEEVTQEVYLALLDGIGRLRVETEAALMAWLFQVARNKIADRLRARYRRPTAPLEAAGDRPAEDAPPLDRLEAEADRAEVRRALEELTPEQREVVIGKYVLGYTNAFIGEAMGKNSNAVNQLHHRALARLRGLLSERGVTP